MTYRELINNLNNLDDKVKDRQIMVIKSRVETPKSDFLVPFAGIVISGNGGREEAVFVYYE